MGTCCNNEFSKVTGCLYITCSCLHSFSHLALPSCLLPLSFLPPILLSFFPLSFLSTSPCFSSFQQIVGSQEMLGLVLFLILSLSLTFPPALLYSGICDPLSAKLHIYLILSIYFFHLHFLVLMRALIPLMPSPVAASSSSFQAISSLFYKLKHTHRDTHTINIESLVRLYY